MKWVWLEAPDCNAEGFQSLQWKNKRWTHAASFSQTRHCKSHLQTLLSRISFVSLYVVSFPTTPILDRFRAQSFLFCLHLTQTRPRQLCFWPMFQVYRHKTIPDGCKVSSPQPKQRQGIRTVFIFMQLPAFWKTFILSISEAARFNCKYFKELADQRKWVMVPGASGHPFQLRVWFICSQWPF